MAACKFDIPITTPVDKAFLPIHHGPHENKRCHNSHRVPCIQKTPGTHRKIEPIPQEETTP